MLINLRNALMTGKRLPYQCELEWIYVPSRPDSRFITGPYIDVGFPAGLDVGVEITARINSASTRSEMLTGSFIASGSGYWGIYKYAGYNYKMWGSATKTVAINNDDFYTYRCNWLNSKELNIDLQGASIYSGSLTGSPTFSAENIWLFLINKGSYNLYECENAYVTSARYSIGSQIVRDFIPVRKGTVGYLYDRVSGKLFGNAGTGDFVLGPDKN